MPDGIPDRHKLCREDAERITGNSSIRDFMAQHLAVLRNGDCLIFFIGHTLSLTGSSMVPVALSLAIADLRLRWVGA